VVRRIAFALLILVPPAFCQQARPGSLPELRGHYIGEGVSELLSKEPELQKRLDVCNRDPKGTDCGLLLGAVKKGSRATISTSDWIDFVLENGRIVKLQALVHRELGQINAALTQQFGPRTSMAAFPMHNALGQNWVDHFYVWDGATVFVRLREDNNPASQNHHFVLTIESRAEHEQE